VKAAILTAAVVAGALLAPAASADGLPVQNVDVGQAGVEAPNEDVRYVAVPAHGGTVVQRIRRNGGQVLRSRVLEGRYTIPAVAYDGSAGGLSADGGTLVLIAPRLTFPRAKTSFAVLDTNGLDLRETLTLPGDFSFDAVSPNARWLYLIQYTSPDDPVQYQVRALDLLNGKLHPDPVVDKREPDEAMNGHPVTRAASPDGRWAYTLYQGSAHPFVHALDTVNRDARCIDLDWLHGRKDLWEMRFAVDSGDGTLSVRAGGKDVALVDTRSFEAVVPPPGGSDSWKWILLVFPAAGLVVAAFFAYRAASRRASSRSFGGATSA
jgi:hypothetical protein